MEAASFLCCLLCVGETVSRVYNYRAWNLDICLGVITGDNLPMDTFQIIEPGGSHLVSGKWPSTNDLVAKYDQSRKMKSERVAAVACHHIDTHKVVVRANQSSKEPIKWCIRNLSTSSAGAVGRKGGQRGKPIEESPTWQRLALAPDCARVPINRYLFCSSSLASNSKSALLTWAAGCDWRSVPFVVAFLAAVGGSSSVAAIKWRSEWSPPAWPNRDTYRRSLWEGRAYWTSWPQSLRTSSHRQCQMKCTRKAN